MRAIRLPTPGRVALYAILLTFTLLALLPFWTAITTSLKTSAEVATGRPAEFPSFPTFEPYLAAFDLLKRPLVNSFTFATVAMILQCFIASLGAYALTKTGLPGSTLIFMLLLLAVFVPYQAVLVPLVQTMSMLGIYNTLWALILAHTAYGIPFILPIFRVFYEYIPDSLIKSARVDGAGLWATYRYVVLPLSKLPFIVAASLTFTFIWNDFLFGLVLARGIEAMPATVALANLKGSYAGLWNLQMAGAVIVLLPVVVIYLVLGKYIMRGYMAGAVKG